MKKPPIKFKIGQKVKIPSLSKEGVIKNLTVCPKFIEYQVISNGTKLNFRQDELEDAIN